MKRTATVLILSATALLTSLTPSAAAVEFGLQTFDVQFKDPSGEPVTQAGAHPYEMATTVRFNSEETEGGGIDLGEAAKDVFLTMPPGFVGNPSAVPPCSTADFLNQECGDASALGIAAVEASASVEEKASFIPTYSTVYNLEPPPGEVVKLGWTVLGVVPVTVEAGVAETSPYNVTAEATNISQALDVLFAEITLWGTPADPAHDPLRGLCLDVVEGTSQGICKAGVPEVPFLTLPRSCSGPLIATYRTDSWQSPGFFKEGFSETHDSAGNPIGLSGCGSLDFGPEVKVDPTTAAAESASGLDIAIDVSDEGIANPDGIAAADIAAMELRLPAGVTANPSAAEGLGVCTQAQFAAASLAVAGCPEAAKLGRIEADTPVLENHTLKGEFFLAQQDDPSTPQPGAENPFDSLLAAYLVIRDTELGVFVKLAAKIDTDPKTGQIITTVEDLPPFPLERVRVNLRSGPRAPLITPPSCDANPATPGNDPYTTTAILTPSSGGAPLAIASNFQITSGPGGGPCPAAGIPPFSPGFEAGSQNPAASFHSPFAMRLTRADGEQDITRFSATLPPGVTGKIAGVGRCGEAAIAAAKLKTGRAELASPSCPASSQVGRVLAGAGVGTALTYVPGSLYLAGPYNGAPLSVVGIVPAVAGPFDVGTVVNRVALRLNPVTYRIEVDGASSDPFPHILEGIPLKLRDLRVTTDRPNFTLNPTSCQVFQTAAQILGSFADPFNPADDLAVGRQSRYQASSCASLPFRPKLSLQLKGGTRRGQHPSLRSTVTYPYPSGPGYANVGKAVVILPPTEFIDNAHINNPCTRVQFNANACPPGSVLGTAQATSPLLDEPLQGTVYFRSNGGERQLPDVVVDLKGLFRVTLIGEVDTATPKTNPRLRTTFRNAPDAPVTKFTLNLNGGKKGLLVNSANLCAKTRRATVKLTGQNGRSYDTNPVVKTSCKGKGAKRRR